MTDRPNRTARATETLMLTMTPWTADMPDPGLVLDWAGRILHPPFQTRISSMLWRARNGPTPPLRPCQLPRAAHPPRPTARPRARRRPGRVSRATTRAAAPSGSGDPPPPRGRAAGDGGEQADNAGGAR